MKRLKSLITILIVLIIATSNVFVAYAQGGNPPKGDSKIAALMQKPQGKISDSDLALVVNLALKNQVSVEQLAKFIASLDKDQYEKMTGLIRDRLDITPQTVNDISKRPGPQPNPPCGTGCGYAYGETIENVWTWNYSPKIFASYYYNDPNCDGDPGDMDYVFYYPVGTSPTTQGNLRWTTTNAAVYAAFIAAYGGNLSAFGYNYNEVRLCLGSTAWAVGLNNVKNSVFIHY